MMVACCGCLPAGQSEMQSEQKGKKAKEPFVRVCPALVGHDLAPL